MNKENPRVETEERYPNQAMPQNISEEETETALKGMKCGKAVGADEIPAETWKYMGNFGIKMLCKLFNCIMNTEQMPSDWRQSILIPIFKGKGDIQECKNYRGIKLLSHTLKIWERVVDRRMRQCTHIHESQFGFMPGRSTTDAIFILKQTIEKHREGQKNISSRHVPGMQNSSAQCGRGQLWGGGRTTPRLCLKPISVPTHDGCVDRGCEKGRTWINDVRR